MECSPEDDAQIAQNPEGETLATHGTDIDQKAVDGSKQPSSPDRRPKESHKAFGNNFPQEERPAADFAATTANTDGEKTTKLQTKDMEVECTQPISLREFQQSNCVSGDAAFELETVQPSLSNTINRNGTEVEGESNTVDEQISGLDAQDPNPKEKVTHYKNGEVKEPSDSVTGSTAAHISGKSTIASVPEGQPQLGKEDLDSKTSTTSLNTPENQNMAHAGNSPAEWHNLAAPGSRSRSSALAHEAGISDSTGMAQQADAATGGAHQKDSGNEITIDPNDNTGKKVGTTEESNSTAATVE